MMVRRRGDRRTHRRRHDQLPGRDVPGSYAALPGRLMYVAPRH